VRLNTVLIGVTSRRRMCVRANSPAATVRSHQAERAHLVAADLIDARRFAVLKRTGGGTIRVLGGSIKCKNAHGATSLSLSDFQNIRILTHRNISCRASEL